MLFTSRKQAGELLAKQLNGRRNCIVLAIPRGGVVVGAQVAKKLSCPLDIIVTRKIGAPDNPELAIGALSSKGGLILDQDLISRLRISKEHIKASYLKELEEALRREEVYSQGRSPSLEGKNVILIDDGIATGATIKASIEAVRERKPAKIILAAPVAPEPTLSELEPVVDETIVLNTPHDFYAIGQFYKDFPQVTDKEVIRELKKANLTTH
jgi:predicted phosphoribosyltransferase